MKRILLFLLIISISLSLCACGEKGTNPVAKEVKDYRFTLDALQNTFCDDEGTFTVSGTTATTYDWDYSGYYDRIITAEMVEENKITSITIEYTDLDTEAYKSSEILSKFLKGDTAELSAWKYLSLVPLYDLKDMIMLVGANDSEVTTKLMMDIIENGVSFSKNSWTIQAIIGDDCVSFVANYVA